MRKEYNNHIKIRKDGHESNMRGCPRCVDWMMIFERQREGGQKLRELMIGECVGF